MSTTPLARRFVVSVEKDKISQGLSFCQLKDGRFAISIEDSPPMVLDAILVGRSVAGVCTWSIRTEDGSIHEFAIGTDAAGSMKVALGPLDLGTFSVREGLRSAGTSEAGPGAGDPGGLAEVRAPMPGKVVKVLCKEGDQVKTGQGLVVIEAMKMENELRASRDGKVEGLCVQEGQSVDGVTVLLRLV